MYQHHLQWRKENGVDTILEDFTFTERTPYLQVYPQGYFNTDKLGRPVTIQHLGKIEPKRIKEITTTERMLKYHIQEYERFLKHIAPVCSKLQGRHVDQTFAILDVKGVLSGILSGISEIISAPHPWPQMDPCCLPFVPVSCEPPGEHTRRPAPHVHIMQCGGCRCNIEDGDRRRPQSDSTHYQHDARPLSRDACKNMHH